MHIQLLKYRFRCKTRKSQIWSNIGSLPWHWTKLFLKRVFQSHSISNLKFCKNSLRALATFHIYTKLKMAEFLRLNNHIEWTYYLYLYKILCLLIDDEFVGCAIRVVVVTYTVFNRCERLDCIKSWRYWMRECSKFIYIFQRLLNENVLSLMMDTKFYLVLQNSTKEIVPSMNRHLNGKCTIEKITQSS